MELLSFVDKVFTDEDNKMLDNPISDEDVKASLVSANRNSSPGSDGLTYLTYLTCWEALGHHLSEVLRAIVSSGKLPESMKNSFLVFSPKINKENSTRIKDKRKLSLLQTDFKILSGVLAGRLRKTEQHTISRYQFCYVCSAQTLAHKPASPCAAVTLRNTHTLTMATSASKGIPVL